MKSAADEVQNVDGGQGVTADEVVNTTISTTHGRGVGFLLVTVLLQ